MEDTLLWIAGYGEEDAYAKQAAAIVDGSLYTNVVSYPQ